MPCGVRNTKLDLEVGVTGLWKVIRRLIPWPFPASGAEYSGVEVPEPALEREWEIVRLRGRFIVLPMVACGSGGSEVGKGSFKFSAPSSYARRITVNEKLYPSE
jgi:hypothetical protein